MNGNRAIAKPRHTFRRLPALLALALLAVLALVPALDAAPVSAADAGAAIVEADAPAAPASVTVTRGAFGHGVLNVSWSRVKGLVLYNVRYTDDGGQTWDAGPERVFETSAQITGVNDSLPYYVAVQASNGKNASAWTQSDLVNVECPEGHACAMTVAPGAVTAVTLSRADGTVTADWPAVNGASKYHVTYTTDGGGSWHAPVNGHDNISTNTLTFTADNAKTYKVGVRAGNQHGWSGWVNSSPIGPWTPPAPEPTPTPAPTPTPTPTPVLTPPDAVSSISLSRADGTVTADWPAPDGATKYHVTYTTDGGGSWHAPVNGHDNVQTNTLTFTADNAKTYIVGVRAGNSAGWSGWRNSPSSGPYTPTPPGIVLQDAGGAPLTALSVPEGGEASYRVKLAAAPAEDTEVCVALYTRDDDDPDITFKGQAADVVSIKLTFTSANWNTAQTVTLVAAHDADSVNGARGVTHDAREYYSGHVDITATEIDAVALPAAPAGLTATAGDGAVTLSWDDPSDASITGYQYNVNHNATSTGNFSGWSAWTAISNSAAATSHTFDGLTNGREYRYHLRAVNAVGASVGAPNAPPWFAAATPQVLPPPPAAPENVTVDPGDGYLDIAWDAVTGATGYDVRAKAEGSTTWLDVAIDVPDPSLRYITGQTIDYVAVRARNAGGASAWTEKSRMPADDFMNVASGISVPAGVASASGGASIQSGASIQAQLAAPTGFTVMRYETRITEIDLNWSNVSGATAYNVICSPGQSGWNWHACGWDNDGTVTYTSVSNSQTRPVTATHYERKAGESSHVAGKYRMGYQRAYRVSVRAVNANASDASDWTNSGIIRPIFATLRDFTYSRSAGSITMSWTPNYWTTGYEIECATYDSTQTPYVPSYTRCATLTDQDNTAAKHTVTISTWTAGGTDYSIDDTKRYDIRICSTNATGRGCTLAPWIYPPTLTASNVAATTATLTIANYTGSWYYKHTNTGATCDGLVSGTTKNLTGLTGGTSYTYSAYSDSSCTTGNLIATASAFTTSVSVSTLGGADNGVVNVGGGSPTQRVAQAFTTGGNTGGYTLSSIAIAFRATVGSPTDLEVTLHAASGLNPKTETTLATLSGSNPSTAGSYTFTCSSGCDLSASTTYFVYVKAPNSASGSHYLATFTSSDETLTPSGNGWSMADKGRLQYVGVGWFDSGSHYRIAVTATRNPTLTASNVAATTATLTIANHHDAWYYKHTNTGATCDGPVSGTTKNLTGLTGGTSYTYKAYADSACKVLLATAAAFTTPNT